MDGAGFSKPLGFPNMRELLLRLLEEPHQAEFSLPIDGDDVPTHQGDSTSGIDHIRNSFQRTVETTLTLRRIRLSSSTQGR